jgi:hypothetical protein
MTGTSQVFARASKGAAVAVASFAGLGTVAALWENPLFIRMMPAGGWEIALLAMMSILLGTYVVARRPFCAMKTVGAGSVLGFIGVACPVCNQVLLMLFGGELLLIYFEPVRIYVAAAGVVLIAGAVARELVLARRIPMESAAQ